MATSDRVWVPTPPKDPPDGPYTLEIDKENLFNHNYIDPEGRVAFTVEAVNINLAPDTSVYAYHANLNGLELNGHPVFDSSLNNGTNPNMIVRIAREGTWSSAHSGLVMGPDRSYLFFGPEASAGFVEYGSGPTRISMSSFLRRGKKEGSLNRYFRCLHNKDYKWRVGSHYMECLDGNNLLATFQIAPPSVNYFARVIVQRAAMPIITEIMTSLELNRMALALPWDL